ncbi:hypothetical protein E2C01_068380 [Portunus trituberculatus]|uniref:Uncharacterized protein n=1 Tax=Portunus trituberculatus TaxID=210409 RepID=A0A5B7HW18_PORTR|nr:hypothetical protein [Portunus trituberculatus]
METLSNTKRSHWSLTQHRINTVWRACMLPGRRKVWVMVAAALTLVCLATWFVHRSQCGLQ